MPPVPVSRGHVLVACAEGDWHSLPAQAIAEVLRTRGWDVSFLGASTPASHVGFYLDRRPATAVAVSCSGGPPPLGRRQPGGVAPAAVVGSHRARRPPTAVAVSCSVALSLMGVRQLVEVAHERRIPVLAGGLG